MKVSDTELIDQIRNGDARKYAVLVDRHKDMAFTLALRLIGNPSDAEELVQDAFIRAYRGLDSFRRDAKFSTWFYRIVYNLCLSRMMRRKAEPVYVDIDGEWNESPADDDDLPVDERVAKNELMVFVGEAVEKLPLQYRSVISLFYIQEMTYEEISEMMQLPLGTVKTNLFRARNALRKLLNARLKGELV